jgi:N-acetyl sugar amidotransferase
MDTTFQMDSPKTFFGLPDEVKFCKRCVISNQRPNSSIEHQNKVGDAKKTIHFDEEGVCDACRVAEQKDREVNWDDRETQLLSLLDKHRSKDGSYDCLVPGSGGKDSVMAAHLLKYKYGMNPLTVTWAPHIYTEIGHKNFDAWIHSGFDNYKCTPNGHVHRLLTKYAVENLCHPFQPFILGQKNLAPKMAILHNLPLVFYGENEAEYGNPSTDTLKAVRSSSYYSVSSDEYEYDKVFLGGESAQKLMEVDKLSKADVDMYLPPKAKDLQRIGVNVQYLGYYVKWDPQEAYYYAAEHCGFQANPERTEGTYSKYNSLDDRIDGFHYYTTYIKFGIGRATYDAAQEIRNKKITREEGVALVQRYDGEFPMRYYKEILAYLSMTEQEFTAIIDRNRSPHLWARHTDGTWQLKYQVQNT